MFYLLLSLAFATEPLSWDVEAGLYGPTDEGRELHGAPISSATYTLACEETRQTRNWVGWSCAIDDLRVRKGAQATVPVVDPSLTFQLKWNLDGTLKTVQARGSVSDDVETWALLGIANLAVPVPTGGWTSNARRIHADPRLLGFAGSAVRRASVELRVIRQHSSGTKIDVYGAGILDASKTTDLARGAVGEDVSVDATGTIMLDARHDVQTRTTALWLHRREGSKKGNLGSQRVTLMRNYPGSASE